ncbi:hypothetical protein NW762_008247 [Fusarium torreyae]|uniref:Heterokaryon incompatibility domain-containing protein n=1 Tax=Fusarium torreyae TaxID=1237075 RepID=A0A9W8RZH0_9HYPO|nr:hypothetical protein NW762_008247 [Fusarium torreyae]
MEAVLKGCLAELKAKDKRFMESFNQSMAGFDPNNSLFNKPQAKFPQPTDEPRPTFALSSSKPDTKPFHPPLAINHNASPDWKNTSDIERWTWPQGEYWRSESSSRAFAVHVTAALKDGMDLNISWSRDQMERPVPTSGCCEPGLPSWWKAWCLRNTPLHQALWLENLDLAKFLLDAGADVNIRNAYGRTPIHEAVDFKRRDVVAFLIKHGADANALTAESTVRYHANSERQGIQGLLPLHIALADGNSSLIQLLLDGGADASWTTPDGWNLLDLAVLAEDRRAVALLLSYNKDFVKHLSAKPSPLPDQKTAARALLAIATSEELFPPANLRPVYLYALSQVDVLVLSAKEPRNAVFSAAERLAESLLAQLRSIAGMEMEVPLRNLCDGCKEFQTTVRYAAEDEKEESRHWYELHENREQLIISADQGCPSCIFLVDLFNNDNLREEQGEKKAPRYNTDEATSDTDERIWLCIGYHIEVHCRGKWMAISQATVDANLLPDPSIPSGSESGAGSQQDLTTAKLWLDTCKSSPQHSDCQQFARVVQASGDGERPARLICVGDREKDPVLIEQVTDSMLYVALSYIKGQSESAIETTKANREEHMKGIPVEKLPPTFKDAILATRKLGLEYIWIDAVCIVQDDSQDWAREVSNLHSIFSHAELTMSGLLTKSTAQALYQPRSARTVCPLPIKLWKKKNGRKSYESGVIYCDVLLRHWLLHEEQKHVDFNGMLLSRGWVVQEHFLSPRILYFGKNMLHWECLCRQALGADPAEELPISLPGWQKIRDRRETKKELLKTPLDSRSEALRIWWQQVESYTQNGFFRETDRMAAFWGFSKFMEHLLNSGFVGGILWGEHLGASLCWHPGSRISEESVLPSWTWMNIKGPVSFEWLHRGGELVPLTVPVSSNVQIDISTSHVSGSITLKGSLYNVKLLDEYLPRSIFTVTHVFDSSDHMEPEEYYAFDLVAFGQGPHPTGYGYPRWPAGQPPYKIFLLLQEIEKGSGQYRRAGLGKVGFASGGHKAERTECPWIDDKDKFDDTITLI